MSKLSTKYVCSNCGYETIKWLGKCPSCENWNTFLEEFVEDKKKTSRKNIPEYMLTKLSSIDIEEENRIKTNIEEFDRVLGGGIMPGSVVLIGGDPGIGKSTLVLQAISKIDKKIIYVTGEESIGQISLRAKRLKISFEKIFILTETQLDVIINSIEKYEPEIVVIDSIQVIYNPELENTAGTVTQIRECTSELMHLAKKKKCAFLIIGHVTKDGLIAGPKILEHIVDTVLQFEGEKSYTYRILRAQKNRFGSTNEIGIFEMQEDGLHEVKNPSEIFLSQREKEISGSVITSSMEGTRPILLEVQALVTPSVYGNPQRVATGFDYRRLSILLAVLEKRANLKLSSHNVFLNIAGGIKIEEPAVDLAICCAIASSYKGIPIGDTVLIGEVGLTGEIRAVSNIEKRLNEAKKLGFKGAIIPKRNMESIQNDGTIEVYGMLNIEEVLNFIF